MKIKLILAVIVTITMIACTSNSRAKKFGGKVTIDLPVNQKLVNITWKESNMWYLTKPMTITDSAETYTFREESNMGIWEGTIIIKESKSKPNSNTEYLEEK